MHVINRVISSLPELLLVNYLFYLVFGFFFKLVIALASYQLCSRHQIIFFFSYGDRRVYLVLSPRIHLCTAHGKTWPQSNSQRFFRHRIYGNKQRSQPNYLHVQMQRIQSLVKEIIQRDFGHCSAAVDWSPSWSITSSIFIPSCSNWGCESPQLSCTDKLHDCGRIDWSKPAITRCVPDSDY